MTLPVHVEAAIVGHARETSPAECCGLLIGRGDVVVEAAAVQNAAQDPVRRYKISPRDYFEAVRRARPRGLQVIGAYHSHPRSAATPSPTDRAQGFADFIFVIVSLAVEPPHLAAWRWHDGNFADVPIVRLS